MIENFAEDLNKRTLTAQEKIKAGGEGALEARFELNKIAEEAENVREEAEQENAQFNEKKKLGKDPGIIQNSENRENTIEDKTIAPIYMVYRDNRNWEKYAPKIIEHIRKELRGQIEVQVFPRGIDKNEIKKWYQDNEDKFKGKFLLSDETCQPVIPLDGCKERIDLDRILEKSNTDTIRDFIKEYFDEQKTNSSEIRELKDYKNLHKDIFKIALEKNNPKKITFVKKLFGDHIDFIDEAKEERGAKKDEIVLDFFRNCLIEAGYPETNISVVYDLESLNDPEVIQSIKDEWFFIDGHNSHAEEYRLKDINVFSPGSYEIIKSNDNILEKKIISGIDCRFKKIDSAEDFITLFGSDPTITSYERESMVQNNIGNSWG
ncbi:MAG: hypothetical protein WCG45_01185 [bacterium]